MDNQVDLRQELEFLENFISVSEKQLNSLARGLEDYTRALSVLQDQNVGTSTDTLLSVGGGVFVRGSVKPDADTLVSILFTIIASKPMLLRNVPACSTASFAARASTVNMTRFGFETLLIFFISSDKFLLLCIRPASSLWWG